MVKNTGVAFKFKAVISAKPIGKIIATAAALVINEVKKTVIIYIKTMAKMGLPCPIKPENKLANWVDKLELISALLIEIDEPKTMSKSILICFFMRFKLV